MLEAVPEAVPEAANGSKVERRSGGTGGWRLGAATDTAAPPRVVTRKRMVAAMATAVLESASVD